MEGEIGQNKLICTDSTLRSVSDSARLCGIVRTASPARALTLPSQAGAVGDGGREFTPFTTDMTRRNLNLGVPESTRVPTIGWKKISNF